MRGSLSQRNSEFLLAAVLVARATACMFSKLLLESMGSFTLIALRSLLAFAFLLLIFRKRLKEVSRAQLRGGFLLGLAFFVIMAFELTGLRFTTSVAISFEENTAVAIVPLLMIFITKKAPSQNTVLRVLLAFTGVVLLCFRPEGFLFNIGDVFGILTAVSYAGAILLTSRLAKHGDPLLLGIFEVGFMGLLSVLPALLFETPSLPRNGTEWGYLLYLALVCSSFGFTLQPLAQRGTTEERAGAFTALIPVTAAVLGAVFLHETLTPKGVIGGILIIVSILIP